MSGQRPLSSEDVNVHISMQALETTMTNMLRVLSALQTSVAGVFPNTGITAKYYDSAASTNATSVVAGAAILHNIVLVNTTVLPYYLKIYDKASAPTVGTDVPVQTFAAVANTTNGGVTQIQLSAAAGLSLGLAFALTAGVAQTDTANAVTGIGINLGYS